MTGTAVLSPDGLHRYRLDRDLPRVALEIDLDDPTIPQAHGRPVLFVMLNPSTADADLDDPTIRRCKRFAERLGAGRLTVVNLYSYRATNPAELDDALGAGIRIARPETDDHIAAAAAEAAIVLAAWGARQPGTVAGHVARVANVLAMLPRPVYTLGRTAAGAPRHPLYIKADAPIEVYR